MKATLESVWEVLRENAKRLEESQRIFEARLEADKALLREQIAEHDRWIAEANAMRAKADAMRAKADAMRAETETKRVEYLELQKQRDVKLDRKMALVSKQIADLSETLGKYAEGQVRARIRELFNERGIHINRLWHHFEGEDGKGGFVYEVDIVLANARYIILVEVKHQLKVDDVKDHAERMEKCVAFPAEEWAGKTLLGCVAGVIVSAEVERYANRQGFFVLKPSGQSVTLGNPNDFKPKEWVIDSK